MNTVTRMMLGLDSIDGLVLCLVTLLCVSCIIRPVRAQHVTPESRLPAFNTSQSAQPRKPRKTLPPKSPDPQGGVETQRRSSSNKSTPLGFKIKRNTSCKKVQIQTRDEKRNRSASPRSHAKLFLKSLKEQRASN